jgi:hypothetical protein
MMDVWILVSAAVRKAQAVLIGHLRTSNYFGQPRLLRQIHTTTSINSKVDHPQHEALFWALGGYNESQRLRKCLSTLRLCIQELNERSCHPSEEFHKLTIMEEAW